MGEQRRGRWLSTDPAKAAAERFFLIYSPIWIAFVGLVMGTGMYRGWSDLGYLLFGLGVGLPVALIPALTPHRDDVGRKFWETSWFRMNLWIAIYVFIGSYIGTHYFFDVAGMRYRFPTEWNLQAMLVGKAELEHVGAGTGREVPLFLYPLTQAYFMTYHVAMICVLRYLGTRFELGAAAKFVVIAVMAYATAFAETFFMAVPAIDDIFEYVDRRRMLTWGSVFYATYFVVSVPVFARLDEGEDGAWSLGRTVASALAVGMTVVLLLDLWARCLGPI